MTFFSRKLFTGVSVAAGGLVYCHYKDKNNSLNEHQQWITGYAGAPVKWHFNWDRREPDTLIKAKKGKFIDENSSQYKEELERVSAKATKHLFLIRHGQYNLMGRSDEERSLTSLGQTQAHFTGLRLKELEYPFTHLIKSTMRRAQETAEVIEEQLKESTKLDLIIENCNLLEEGCPIPPEPPYGGWTPDLKNFYEDGPRIEAAFRKYVHRADPSQEKDSFEIIVCHGNIIRYFVCRALQLPAEAWLRMTLDHCSITQISIPPSGRLSVKRIGDSGHIPANTVTYN